MPHEFRPTLVPERVTPEDIREIAELLHGAERYILAGFRPGKTLDPAYADRPPYTDAELQEMCAAASAAGTPCRVRLNSR